MNQCLISVLKANGIPLSPEIAADILLAADQLPTLVPLGMLKRIRLRRSADSLFPANQ